MTEQQITAAQLAQQIGATLHGDGTMVLFGLAPLSQAIAGQLTFLANPKFVGELKTSKASAVIVPKVHEDLSTVQLVHPNPQLAMAKAANLFYRPRHGFQGQSPLAFIAPSAKVHASVTVFPFAFIGDGAVVDEDAVIYPQVYIGAGSRVGARTVLYAGVKLMDACIVGADCIIHAGSVLGADGFGFVPAAEGIIKIPQVGNVVVEDQVEIGGLCTIDRATFETTRIKFGSKLDSHVHVGHNVEVGAHVMLCAQVGVAGSTKIGDRCIAAGQVGFSNGITVGPNMIFGGKAGVTRTMTGPGEYHGMPAIPSPQWIRQTIALEKLPDLLKRVKVLEDRMEIGDVSPDPS